MVNVQRSDDDAIDEIRSRADLEIELAHLALRLQRAAAHVVEGGTRSEARERRAALAEWFESIADELMSRTVHSLRPYARSRIAAMGNSDPAMHREAGLQPHGVERSGTGRPGSGSVSWERRAP